MVRKWYNITTVIRNFSTNVSNLEHYRGAQSTRRLCHFKLLCLSTSFRRCYLLVEQLVELDEGKNLH